MSQKRAKGLGMGLGALFQETETAYDRLKPEENAEAQGTLEIDMKKISPNPNQPRKKFDADTLKELADSIRTHGLIQPIVVNKFGNDKYMIIAGERRFRAALLCKMEKIPAIVKEYDERTVKEISIIENLQREDLNPVEAARAIRQLMDEFHFTQEEVSERLGKSRSAIANTLRLLNLNDFVLNAVIDGKLSAGHARTLVVVEDSAMQIELCKIAIERELSVRDFEKMVKIALTKPLEQPEPKPKKELSLELKDMVDRMQQVFATRVHAVGNDRKGRIYIDYFSRDDLDRILEIIETVK